MVMGSALWRPERSEPQGMQSEALLAALGGGRLPLRAFTLINPDAPQASGERWESAGWHGGHLASILEVSKYPRMFQGLCHGGYSIIHPSPHLSTFVLSFQLRDLWLEEENCKRYWRPTWFFCHWAELIQEHMILLFCSIFFVGMAAPVT